VQRRRNRVRGPFGLPFTVSLLQERLSFACVSWLYSNCSGGVNWNLLSLASMERRHKGLQKDGCIEIDTDHDTR
jgi:hypothetical protein